MREGNLADRLQQVGWPTSSKFLDERRVGVGVGSGEDVLGEGRRGGVAEEDRIFISGRAGKGRGGGGFFCMGAGAGGKAEGR